MGVGVLDSTLDNTEISIDDIFDVENTSTANTNMDGRRRSEDRIEELRLQRELRDFDYDI